MPKFFDNFNYQINKIQVLSCLLGIIFKEQKHVSWPSFYFAFEFNVVSLTQEIVWRNFVVVVVVISGRMNTKCHLFDS